MRMCFVTNLGLIAVACVEVAVTEIEPDELAMGQHFVVVNKQLAMVAVPAPMNLGRLLMQKMMKVWIHDV